MHSINCISYPKIKLICAVSQNPFQVGYFFIKVIAKAHCAPCFVPCSQGNVVNLHLVSCMVPLQGLHDGEGGAALHIVAGAIYLLLWCQDPHVTVKCLPCWSQEKKQLSFMLSMVFSHLMTPTRFLNWLSLICSLLLTPLTTPYCWAIFNIILMSLVWPSAGSGHTCQTGFSLVLQAAVTPSYPNLTMGCHTGWC